MIGLSFFGYISTMNRLEYEGVFGSEMKALYAAIMVLDVTRLIVKICACAKKYTERGFYLLIASSIIDAIAMIVSGYLQGVDVGTASFLLAGAIVAPNMVYVIKRKSLFKD